MNILAIETSSDACTCALHTTDGAVLERAEVAPREHTTLLLPMVEQVLAEAGIVFSDVDLFAYGCGPGSFTGVRIAACTTQGLALAVDRPVLPVSSLAAAAMTGGRPGESVIAAFDARLGEVYLGTFTLDPTGLARTVGDEHLASPGEVPLPSSGQWVGVGQGWAAHGEVLGQRLGDFLLHPLHEARVETLPTAAAIARIAASADPNSASPPERALPSYLRRDVATPRRAR